MMLTNYSKILSDTPNDKTFKTGAGEFRNLGELRNALVEKGNSLYDEFVNDNENHFANWIAGVFDDHELAHHLKKAKSYTDTVKLLDNRMKFAELWLNFNSDKEVLHNYLLNGELSLKDMIAAPEYNPENQKFETIFDMNLPSITKITNPPKATILPEINFNAIFEKKQPLDISQDEVLRNAIPLPHTVEIKHKAIVEKQQEKRLLEQLESQFPGLRLSAEPPRKKSFFEKLFSGFRK